MDHSQSVFYFDIFLSYTQISTQRSGARPAGVGLLIGGVDDQGCHLYQTCPSGNIYDHVAVAIGMIVEAINIYINLATSFRDTSELVFF